MKEVVPHLVHCALFKHFNEQQIDSILNVLSYRTETYKREAVIAFEGDQCNHLGIVLSGKVELQSIYPSGKVLTLTQVSPGHIFGEAILFSNENQYPVSITAAEKTTILFISKEKIIHGLMHHPILLENFLSLLSNKLVMLNRKVKVLSSDSIRQKIATYLIREYQAQHNLILQINLSRKAMSEHMGIQRPSLSRELINMKEEGLINYDKKTIEILDLEALEDEII